MSKRNNAERE